MSKKSFIIILVLSVVVTYGVAFIAFATGIYKLANGFPFSFTSFNFLGAETDLTMLILDIAFWSATIWVIWKAISYLFGREGR